MWKLDSKLNFFSLVGKIPAPGVVNSLQLITPPKGFSQTIAWGSQVIGEKEAEAQPLLLVAGLGQEHRLGRWLKITDGGVVNGAMVAAYSPRTCA